MKIKTKDDYRVVQENKTFYVEERTIESYFNYRNHMWGDRTSGWDKVSEKLLERELIKKTRESFWGDIIDEGWEVKPGIKWDKASWGNDNFYRYLRFDTCKEAFAHIDLLLDSAPKVIDRKDCK